MATCGARATLGEGKALPQEEEERGEERRGEERRGGGAPSTLTSNGIGRRKEEGGGSKEQREEGAMEAEEEEEKEMFSCPCCGVSTAAVRRKHRKENLAAFTGDPERNKPEALQKTTVNRSRKRGRPLTARYYRFLQKAFCLASYPPPVRRTLAPEGEVGEKRCLCLTRWQKSADPLWVEACRSWVCSLLVS